MLQICFIAHVIEMLPVFEKAFQCLFLGIQLQLYMCTHHRAVITFQKEFIVEIYNQHN